MSSVDTIPYEGDSFAELDVLTDALTGQYINDATVTVTLYTMAGGQVSGATSLAATYVAGSNGKYRAIIPRTAQVIVDRHYKARCLAVSSSLQMPFWQEVIVRRFPA